MTAPESAGPAISRGRAGSSGQVGWPGQVLLTFTAAGHRPPDGRGHGFVRGLLHQRLHGAGAGAAAGPGGGLGGDTMSAPSHVLSPGGVRTDSGLLSPRSLPPSCSLSAGRSRSSSAL